ncbi:MAG: DUF47 domain-containing protein [Saprospiraceae bacterium]
MNLNKILTLFAPKDRVFYALFAKDAENMLLAARTLKELFTIAGNNRRVELVQEIERLEHVGDDITHEIFTQLSLNFITPFDREDIHALASRIDDVVDYIFAAAMRLDLTNIDKVTEPMTELADLIERCALQVHLAVTELKGLDYKKISEILVEVHRLENLADTAFDKGISDLFDHEKDPITLIKYQQMLDILENATDRCEDVANVINSIILKYA